MKLEPNTGGAGGFGWNIEGPLPPPGQYVGLCLDIRDSLGVERKAYQSEAMEKRDVTRFLFGIRHQQTHQLYLVQTFEMTISGAAQSNLVQFLRGWTNKDPYGFDYLTLKGQGALLTIGHKQSTRTPGLMYAQIISVSPVYPTLQNEVPNAALFAEQVAKANTPRAMPTTSGAVGPGIAPSTPPAHFPSMTATLNASRKFWTMGPAGVVLVPEDQIVQRGEPDRQVMAENQQGGWVTAGSVMNFPTAPVPPPVPMPPQPPMPVPVPPPPPAPVPATWPLPQREEEALPF